MRRSDFLRLSAAAATALTFDPLRLAEGLAATCSGVSPYGPLGSPDARGIMLPTGFTSRVLAQSGQVVAGTSYTWHDAPDGGACFPTANGGWIYVSNSEVAQKQGGVGALTFNSGAIITDAKRVLSGTTRNCSGGPTPWGTWLSCEETNKGRVWEVDPTGTALPLRRAKLGRFRHEAAAVDPVRKICYLTEDEPDGRFYRFRYQKPNKLTLGTLEVATVNGGNVTWTAVPDPTAASGPTRLQVPGSTVFDGAEGAWLGGSVVHFTTKGDNRVWAYDGATQTISVIYDKSTSCNPVLGGVDNVTGTPFGDIYVAEDGDNMQLVLLTPDGSVSPFLQVTGQAGSEITGPAFNPAGNRLYFSSQRAGVNGTGITYEVTGPFRTSA
jgi:secreted PhoX family phosphatase